MDILVFKTNLRNRKYITAVEPHISAQPGVINWNVDLKDADKILRVESLGVHPSTIEGLVKRAGYKCEELKD